VSRRILVVDDDKAMVATLSDILALHGWDAIPAHDGEDAIAIAAERDVDVVLMDVRMPRIDGVAALRAIKARRADTRVILMTAFAAHDLLAEAEREGALSILRKPVDVGPLLALLEAASNARRPVLVVDDEPSFLRSLCGVLSARGVSALEAQSLAEALERMNEDQPSAVLLDLKLDSLDPQPGLLAIRNLSPAILLILYSGHPTALSQAVERAPPGVIDAAFTKPLPLDQLLELLNDDPAG